MSQKELSEPEFQKNSFHCPHCEVFALQRWNLSHFPALQKPDGTQLQGFGRLLRGVCDFCGDVTIWVDGEMVFPDVLIVRSPNADLADDIKDDYREAATILNKSPRGSAALLRLCIQKLCIQLGEKGSNINDDIRTLIQKGLPETIKQSLDIVRVVGNEAVHPGQMDLKDDQETAMQLFGLVNLIAQTMITTPKEVAEFYTSLPESKRQEIERRDKKIRE